MALSDDQRAMLRLLAQREQGYEDMAALMGVSVEELRGRVKEALSELEKEGEEPPQLPPEPPKESAAPAPPVSGEPPELSATPPAAPALPPQSPKPKRDSSPLTSKGALIGIAAVAAAAVIVVVLLIALGGGGGDSDSTSSASTNESSTTTASAEAPSAGGIVAEATEAAEAGSSGQKMTMAKLSSEDGSDATGVAVFGRVKNKLALQVIAEGLEPLESGDVYAVWIAASPSRMLPLATSTVNAKGELGSQLSVPTELLVYLAQGTFDEITITRASKTKLETGLEAATKAKEPPAYTGTRVLSGKITGPIIGAAKRIEEKEAAEGK